MFNWFTSVTGVTWSVETVSPGCAETHDVELGRCRGLSQNTFMDSVCTGTGLYEDSKWNAGMEGCYVSEQECQHSSAALGSSRTVITPAEGSHGVGCSFQASEASLRAELSVLTLEKLRVRAEYAGVDTTTIPPRSIAASMVNRTGEAIIDLLVKKLSSGCAPPKCAVPAGTITEIRSTSSGSGNGMGSGNGTGNGMGNRTGNRMEEATERATERATEWNGQRNGQQNRQRNGQQNGTGNEIGNRHEPTHLF